MIKFNTFNKLNMYYCLKIFYLKSFYKFSQKKLYLPLRNGKFNIFFVYYYLIFFSLMKKFKDL